MRGRSFNRPRVRAALRAWKGPGAAVLVCGLVLAVSAAPGSAADPIAFHGASQAVYASDSTASLRLTAPAGAQSGDVLIASLGFGSSYVSSQPTLTPPAGWTLVTRTDRNTNAALAIYRHVFSAGETSYTWTASALVGGTVFLGAFSGVDSSNPVDVAAGLAQGASTSLLAPSVTTTAANEMLVASFYGYRSNASTGSWTPPMGMTEIADANNGGSRSGSVAYSTHPFASATGQKAATPSATLDYGIAALIALRPSGLVQPPPPPPPPATGVVFHGASQAAYGSDATTSLRLTAPAAAQPGDVLVASLGFGSSAASTQPNADRTHRLDAGHPYQQGFDGGRSRRVPARVHRRRDGLHLDDEHHGRRGDLPRRVLRGRQRRRVGGPGSDVRFVGGDAAGDDERGRRPAPRRLLRLPLGCDLGELDAPDRYDRGRRREQRQQPLRQPRLRHAGDRRLDRCQDRDRVRDARLRDRDARRPSARRVDDPASAASASASDHDRVGADRFPRRLERRVRVGLDGEPPPDRSGGRRGGRRACRLARLRLELRGHAADADRPRGLDARHAHEQGHDRSGCGLPPRLRRR